MDEVSDIYLLETIKSLHGLKSTSEKAIAQIKDNEMHFRPVSESNTVAVIMQHVAGNMLSRFTDFLTTDGEKSWRKRDDEFEDENLSRTELFEIWEKGWQCIFDALSALKPDDLLKTVYIRGEAHSVIRALNRQLVHYAYHSGQIVYLCKQIRNTGFETLTMPKVQAGKKNS